MDNSNPFAPGLSSPAPLEPSTEAPAAEAPAQVPAASEEAPSVQKFKSCRWRSQPEDGEFCTHRDVLPFAGKDGFVADSWCPECAYYKLRRTPKKRDKMDYTY